ncbi:MAG: hypothetical protein QOJ64_1690 [Acidobacteriota bacterium]|nr:hypothetical protein [Acidobacteriota bacterium]
MRLLLSDGLEYLREPIREETRMRQRTVGFARVARASLLIVDFAHNGGKVERVATVFHYRPQGPIEIRKETSSITARRSYARVNSLKSSTRKSGPCEQMFARGKPHIIALKQSCVGSLRANFPGSGASKMLSAPDKL